MQHYTAPDGITLAYRDEGSGTPVLALAGLTRNSSDFDFLAPHLDSVRLIRPDYRGRGASDRADPTTYTPATEAGDVLALMDHLGLEKAAVIGTSRGGLIGMILAATARDRLTGLCLNDVGPVLETAGLDDIATWIGRRPSQTTLDEAAAARAQAMAGFENVPMSRWREEVEHLYTVTPDGLDLRYDPRLREAVATTQGEPLPDLWPLFDALAGLPVALIHGVNSNILSAATADEMTRRRPDMIRAEVPGRGHVPFLDEPEALTAIHAWLEKLP